MDLVVGNGDFPPFVTFDFAEIILSDDVALFDALWRCCCSLTNEHVFQAVVSRTVQNRTFVLAVLRKALNFFTFDGHRTFVFIDTMTVKDADLNHSTRNAWRETQRRVTHIACLFTKDGAQQLFFWCHRAFALWRDLADQNVTWVHFSADVDNAGFIKAAKRVFTHIWNIAGDVFWSKLRVAGHYFEFFDMDRCEHIVFHDTLGDQDRIFVVISVPRHKRDEAVLAQCEFTQFSRRTISNNVASFDYVTDLHQRLLVDASILVGALEFLQRVNVYARLAGFNIASYAHNDTGCIDLVDNTCAACANGSARVTCHGFFHASSDKRCFCTQQRHSLTLHVGTHQCAVGVIVFQERDERGCNRNKLLWRNVHQSNLVTRCHQEFTCFTRRNQIFDKAAIGVQFGVCLRDGVLLLFHCGEIDHVVGDLVVHDLAIWRFDKAIFVHAAE